MVKMVNFKFYVYFTIIEKIFKVKNANEFSNQIPLWKDISCYTRLKTNFSFLVDDKLRKKWL